MFFKRGKIGGSTLMMEPVKGVNRKKRSQFEWGFYTGCMSQNLKRIIIKPVVKPQNEKIKGVIIDPHSQRIFDSNGGEFLNFG